MSIASATFSDGPDGLMATSVAARRRRRGAGKPTAALQAGQLDVAMVGVSSAVSSQITDSPMVVLSVNAVLLTDNIVCQGDVKTADDIKGKRIALSTFGGTSNGAALLGIKALNLTTNDVVITP